MGDWIRPVPERALRTRARLVAGLFCAVCFLGLAVRLFYLQLVGSGW